MVTVARAPRPPSRQAPVTGAREPVRSPGADPEDVATFFLVLLTIASAFGLRRVFEGRAWVAPVLASILVVHGSCWVMRRRRVPRPVSLLVTFVLLCLVITATILHAGSFHGLPTGATLSQAHQALRDAWHEFATTQAPVVPTPGFELWAAAGAGFVAFAGDWISFARRAVLPAAAPAFAMFLVTCTAGQGPGRGFAVAVEVTALCAFLLARAAVEREGSIWLGGVRAGALRWAARAGIPLAVLALASSFVVAPFPGGPDGHGALGWRGHGNERVVDDPTVDMETQLLDPSDSPMFTVESPYPSYWRLTTLSTFTGVVWTSTGTYRSFGSKLPATASVPAATQVVRESFQIQELDSPWLPDAFNPISVQGVKGVTYDPTSGSLITNNRTDIGMSYEVTSYRYLASLSRADLEAALPVTGSALSTYTQLPPTLSREVVDLARAITAKQPTEFDKAIAIQQYLLSPPFQYSLRPAVDGSGDNALLNFLFVTHQGYCQQFAGAFAVLARAAGLPTRVAVGFAQGNPLPNNGGYEVSEADAHSWPEVYFGAQYGWVPFEPTPTYVNPEASGYDASGLGGKANPSSTPAAPAQSSSSTPTTAAAGSGHSTDRQPADPTASSGTLRHGSGFARVVEVVAVGAAILALWIPLNLALRRLRWRIRRRRAAMLGPAGLVMASWAEVSELLAWRGIRRNPSETFDEFARRASVLMDGQAGDPDPDVARDVSRLAALVGGAAYAAAARPEWASSASEMSGRIHRWSVRSAGSRRLISWLLKPQGFGTRLPA